MSTRMAFNDRRRKGGVRRSQDKIFLLKVFRSVDVDGSGDITANELQKALSNGTWTPFNPETVRLMIGMFDKDHSGAIDYNEFADLWSYVIEWQTCFREYDTDQSGAIDEDELRHALTSFGYRFSDSFIHALMIKFDWQGTQSIAFDNFIQCCVVLETLTDAFKHRDTRATGCITVTYEEFLTMVFSMKS